MRRFIFLCLLIGLLVAHRDVTSGQGRPPLDVFVAHDRSAQTATLYFTDPVSGLSTPVTVNNIPSDALLLDLMTLTPNGVIFRHPYDGQVLIATPDGRLSPHPFIPRQPHGLLLVDWVLSPDKQSIAWVEVFLENNQWVSNLYLSDIDGGNITVVPAAPQSDLYPFRRVMPLALSNDRRLFYYDAAFPIDPRPLTDYFVDYQDVHVYNTQTGLHQRLSGEPGCLCGVGIGNGFILRLEQESGGVFIPRLWAAETGIDTALTPSELPFAQAGDVRLFDGFPFGFYTLAQSLVSSEADDQFLLMQVDINGQAQRPLLPVSGQRWRVVAVEREASMLTLIDVYAGGTYKFNLSRQELTQVSVNAWLGTIEGE